MAPAPKKRTSSDDVQDLEDLLAIDESDLPGEWHKQPSLYTKFSRYAARCEAALEEAELATKTVFADQFTSIRKSEGKEGGKRPSDECVKQQIYASEEYRDCEMHRIRMLERSRLAQGLQKAADQRQYSLMHLSKKFLGGDVSGMGHGMKDELTAIVDRAVQRLRPKTSKLE